MTTAPLDSQERAGARMASLLPELERVRQEKARLDAREARLLAQAGAVAEEWADAEDSRVREIPHRAVSAEIASLWRVSDRTVQRQVSDASALVGSYSATLAALEKGEISATHARIIVAAGAVIERQELRAEFEASVLDVARREAASRLAPIAKRRAEWYAEDTFADRHRRAKEQRRVWVRDLDDGMAELGVVLPGVTAHAAYDRLSQLARTFSAQRDTALDGAESNGADPDKADPDKADPDNADPDNADPAAVSHGPGSASIVEDAEKARAAEQPWPSHEEPNAESDARTVDHLRADILSDLLLATDPVAHNNGPTGLAAIHATVQVTVPVLTLIGEQTSDPEEMPMLDGRTPIDAETARLLTGDAPGWDRILTHPVTGSVLEVDRYRPSEELRRHLRVRDQHCRFPGCRVSVARCDADHTVDYALGGETTVGNLAHLCRRHHTLKHATNWTVRQRSGGLLEWTSPGGRLYADLPVSTVAFSPDPECDPAPF